MFQEKITSLHSLQDPFFVLNIKTPYKRFPVPVVEITGLLFWKTMLHITGTPDVRPFTNRKYELISGIHNRYQYRIWPDTGKKAGYPVRPKFSNSFLVSYLEKRQFVD